MIWIIIFLIFLPFGWVLLFGAPYVPTRRKTIGQAFELLELEAGEVFVDLGAGDGSTLLIAAQKGYVCYGYELNPLVWLVAWLRTRRYGKQIKVYCRNFWHQPLPDDTKGVYVFLLDKYMKKLDKKLVQELRPGGRLVSHAFQIPSKKPTSQLGAVFLYKY